MKIYKMPVDSKFRPDHQNYVWPPQNKRPNMDFGVEQDFEKWITGSDLLTDDLGIADWIYLPVYFNRYYINTPDEDGHWGGGVEELSELIYGTLGYGIPTFVISEADERTLHPQINWGDLIMFCASRRDYGKRIDIPLLSAPHAFPSVIPEKRWLASFIGSIWTDGVRIGMKEELENQDEFFVESDNKGEDYFVNLMLSSYIALCPRGTGGQSFRMYESMQLGTVPFYIGDMDCRPFKNWIDWDICSFWMKDTVYLKNYLRMVGNNKKKLLKMGELAQCTYEDFLSYGNWCKFVIRELELL